MLSGNRDDNIYTLWLVVHICNIQAEMKDCNLMEKEFTKFDCYGRI